MPAVKIFDELRKRVQEQGGVPPAERRAMFWFKNYATELTRWQKAHRGTDYDDLTDSDTVFTKQVVGSRHALPGFLYFYLYDPKHKQTLPYYDQFPFTLVIDRYEDGFLGLNFHYLDYYWRAHLFDALYTLREGRAARPHVRDIRMRIQAEYQLLKSTPKYKAFKPCVKRYLFNHIQTPLLKVGAKEWDIALFLPVEMFVKRSKTYVWRESEKKIK